MIKAFDGRNAEVETWLRKLKLVAQLKEIDKLESFLPLYLDGAAFAVYDQLSADDKKDALKIENALLAAFAQDLFSAYDSFQQRTWMPGESVDVYLADLRRLSRVAGVESDALIRCAFICGLPTDVSAQLRASAQIQSTPLSTVAEQARILMGDRLHGAMVAMKSRPGHTGNLVGERKERKKMVCYECGADHPVRFCKERKLKITCWKCNSVGHLARSCTGNDQGELPAPAAPPRI